MILHLIFNSFIVFLALACIVELSLALSKTQNPRLRYLCRALPFLKIPFDIFVFALYDQSLFFNINPLSCEVYVYELLAAWWPVEITLPLTASDHVILPQYIASLLPSHGLSFLTFSVVAIATGGIALKLYQLLRSRKRLQAIIREASPYSYHQITNRELQRHLTDGSARILVSSDIEVPFAAGTRTILLPQNVLASLSHEELEAVIAHELEHLKWKDPLFKLFFSLVSSFCWWIPSRYWLKSLVADQERASDAAITLYGIENYALATAVTKILSQSKNQHLDKTAICFFSSPKSVHVERIKTILHGPIPLSRSKMICSGICALICSLLAFLSIWMC